MHSDPRRSIEPARALISQSPASRRVLTWVYGGRLLLLTALLLRAHGALGALVGPRVGPPLLIGVVIAFTAGSFWYSHGGERAVGRSFCYLQLVFDALLITAAVRLTGGPQSIFVPLYILLICAAALLLPMYGGILIGLLGISLYMISVLIDPTVSPSGSLALQVALFAAVALVTGYLGERLRMAGAALGEVESELRQLRMDTGDILDTVSTGVLTVDGAGQLAYLNPAAEQILSLSMETWLGKPVLARLDAVAPGLGAVISRSASERIAIRRFETSRLGDDDFILGVSTTLVERDDGQTPAVTAIFQDITEKMKAEALRRRAERLEAVAELSASLAHEIKNPLASIRSAVEQITSDAMDQEDAEVLRALAIRESDRLSRLLAEFIDFARVKLTAPHPVDFCGLVRNVVELARAHPDARGREIRFETSALPEEVRVRGAEDLLHRAVFNLVLNAVQWTPEAGVVELTLNELTSDLLSPALGANRLLRLTVADSGPGVPEDIIEDIFNPFFTRRTGGTGLGLALVQRTVEAHGGAIFVDNAPAGSGLGAAFSLYLPVLPVDLDAMPGVHSRQEAASL